MTSLASALPENTTFSYGSVRHQLGQGTSGLVYSLGIEGTYAVKKFRHFRPDFLQDISGLRNLGHHPHIMKLIDVSHHDDSLQLIMPRGDRNLLELMMLDLYPRKGSTPGKFRRLFRRRSTDVLARDTASRIHRYIHQIVSAVCWLNQRGIAHRDLKPDNFIHFAEEDKLVLTDFGLATMVFHEASNVENTQIYTVMYRAPEVLLETGCYFGLETDMWALGCILYELMTGTNLFQGETVGQIISQQSEIEDLSILALNCHNSKYLCKYDHTGTFRRFILAEKEAPAYTANLADLISQMLYIYPEKRIVYWQVMTHPYFANSRSDSTTRPVVEEWSCSRCLDLYRRAICLDSQDVYLMKRRAILLEFLTNYYTERQLRKRTLYYAIELLDICLTHDMAALNWQYEIVYLAESMNEAEYISVEDFCRYIFPLNEGVIWQILRLLDWNLFISTPYDYLIGRVCEEDLEDHISLGSQINYLNVLLLQSLMDITCREVSPQELADLVHTLFRAKVQ